MNQKDHHFGDILKELRMKKRLPLRKVAAEIDIDPSTLNKFELNKRLPNRYIVQKLAIFYKIDISQLLVGLLSDKIADELKDEDARFDILKAAENKLKRYRHEI